MADGLTPDGRTFAPPPLSFERVLVTGAGGFVGHNLCRALLEQLRPGSRMFCAGIGLDIGCSVRWVPFEITDQASVDQAVATARPDLIVHLAAQSSIAEAVDGAATTWRINAWGTLHLARSLAAAAPDCTVLYASTAEVYGLSFKGGRVDEQTALRPQMAYARSKAAAENILDDVLPSTSRLIVARPVNHSGAGQGEQFVIPAIAAQIARAELGMATEIMVGNLDARRDFLHVTDVVNAYLALVASANDLPMRSTFNIASGTSIRIADILSGLCSMARADVRITPDPKRMRPSDIETAVVNSTLLRTTTGWAPQYSLAMIMAEVLDDQRGRAAGAPLGGAR